MKTVYEKLSYACLDCILVLILFWLLLFLTACGTKEPSANIQPDNRIQLLSYDNALNCGGGNCKLAAYKFVLKNNSDSAIEGIKLKMFCKNYSGTIRIQAVKSDNYSVNYAFVGSINSGQTILIWASFPYLECQTHYWPTVEEREFILEY